MPSARPRLLILVVAYYAESTLRWVLDRIPRSVFVEFDCEVLVVDDASGDRTFEVGNEYRREHPEIPLVVLQNRYNQGYGGNQKIGYAWAIKHDFHFVALVHGDGQYAPEELPRLLAPLQNGNADAVFGSRMMNRWGALRGGMPLYKFVGNRILTRFENFILRANLSEFHSGYRIYATKALAAVRFPLNSNDFHFDTEIIIQLLNAGQRILELPIPTYYGTEISRVNGLKYAWNVAMATLRNAAHRSGILYQRRFDPVSQDNRHYGSKLGYASSHSWALAAVPEGARVLDIGAGPEGLARPLREKGCRVAVVDQFAPVSEDPDIEVFVQDLEKPLEVDLGRFDHLLMLDIIEHLRDPEAFLQRVRAQFTHERVTLVLTTPNVAFIIQRLMLLFGQFNYGKAGILDRTHSRLFTFRGIRHLLRDEGFRILEVRGVPAPFPKALGDNVLARFLLGLNLVLIRLSRTLFSYQIFLVAESTPSLEFLIADAEQSRIEAPADLGPSDAAALRSTAGG